MRRTVLTSGSVERPPHPRRLGWIGTAALAMGGSNQSLFLIGALFAGQQGISGQGSAAVPLLILGVLLSYAAAPGWTELVLMSPKRVGGIAAACTAAFRPYSDVLSALAGVCYWWGWVPTCGVTALLSASAIHQRYLPAVPVPPLACLLVLVFTGLNLCGIKWVTRVTIPVACASAGLAFISTLAPVLAGTVDWRRAADFHLTTPFDGWFGGLTSLMAGLYLIGFAAPAFEAATCHVAETVDPVRNVRRAVLASAGMAAIYFGFLPVIWLGALGQGPLGGDLAQVLGPTFAPVFGALGKSAAIWFMTLNMFHGTIQPLAGASRTLSQIAEDGLAPRFLALRLHRTDVPWAATLITAAFAIVCLLIGDPVWLIAAANFTYLIGICLPSVAVFLLRRDAPHADRPYRAPRGTVTLGLLAACIWGVSALLGFQQFGLPTVVLGLAMAYSGAGVYAWRKIEDRRRAGLRAIGSTLHVKLTGAMLLVLGLDAAGYILAVGKLPRADGPLVVALEDIFVAVALLTISVGIVLPGMIAHSADEVSAAARRLATGTLRDFSKAMGSLGRGDLEAAHAAVNIVPVVVRSRDELGALAGSFNTLQEEVRQAALGLDLAREGLRAARSQLTGANADLQEKIAGERRLTGELLIAKDEAEAGNRAKTEFLATMSHEIRTPMNGIIGMTGLLLDGELGEQQRRFAETIRLSSEALVRVINDVLDYSKMEAGRLTLEEQPFHVGQLVADTTDLLSAKVEGRRLSLTHTIGPDAGGMFIGDPGRLRQVLLNLVGNAIKFTERGSVTLGVSVVGEDADRATLAFVVTDTGIGIAASHQPHLFMMFAQADASMARRYGGTGLGLAISKRIVEQMGGAIGFESLEGEGSSFRFTVPMQRASADAPLVAARSCAVIGGAGASVGGHRRLRILVAEDNETNQLVAVGLLTRLGHTVEVASDGLEAVAMIEAADYDLVLMDVHMPRMDGLSAVQAIRAMPSAKSRLLVVAMTANAMQGDRERFLAAGMDDHVAKPIDRARFEASLEAWSASLSRPDLGGDGGAIGAAHGGQLELPVIDHEVELDLRQDLGDGTYDRLARSFADGLGRAVGRLRGALDTGDTAAAGLAAHTLAGEAGNLGFRRLWLRLCELEQACAHGDAYAHRQLARVAAAAAEVMALRAGRAVADA